MNVKIVCPGTWSIQIDWFAEHSVPFPREL